MGGKFNHFFTVKIEKHVDEKLNKNQSQYYLTEILNLYILYT